MRVIWAGEDVLPGEGSRVFDLGEELVPWNDPMDLDIHGERGTLCFLCWRALFWGGELCLVPVGPVGDLDLLGLYWVSVPFVGTGDRFWRMTLSVWLRGSFMVLESVHCYVCEVLGIS